MRRISVQLVHEFATKLSSKREFREDVLGDSHIFKGVKDILTSFPNILIHFSEILYRSLGNVVEHL